MLCISARGQLGDGANRRLIAYRKSVTLPYSAINQSRGGLILMKIWEVPRLGHSTLRMHTQPVLESASKLRLSLTSACNFGCFFCHNEGQAPTRQVSTQLEVSDYVAIVKAALEVGVKSVKLTGGEPLLYRSGSDNIVGLVRAVAALRNHHSFELSMTTNGSLLPRMGQALASAGLDRVTISIHALSPASFAAYIAKVPSGRYVDPVPALDAAAKFFSGSTKVNTVLFGDPATGSVGELPEIIDLVKRSQVSELRLYTIIDGLQLGISPAQIRYWTDGLASEVAPLIANPPDAPGVAARIRDFSSREAELGSARTTFVISNNEGFSVSIDAMRPGRFADIGISDEGPYAIRIGADGLVKAFLDGSRKPFAERIVDSGKGGLYPHGEVRRIIQMARDSLAGRLIVGA